MKCKPNILKVIICVIIILGIITPFVDYFVVIQMFYLLIPFGIILIFSLFVFIANLIKYKKHICKQNSTIIISLIPIFLLTQVISTFVVDKSQKIRCENIIKSLNQQSKNYPESLNTSFGIKYHKSTITNNYELEYNRGFLVREIYTSENKKWESYGWND